MPDIELGINLGRKNRCKKCGAPLRSGFSACERCGEPVGGPAAESQAPGEQTAPAGAAATGEETVIGVIANATRAQGFGSKSYNLVITRGRIIGAELTSKMIAAEAERVAKESKARGENFLEQMAKRALAGVNLYERYYHMSPDAILAENKDNWVIPTAEIRSCEMDEEGGSGYPSKLIIQWPQGKQTFSFAANMLGSGRVKTKDAIALLAQAGINLES